MRPRIWVLALLVFASGCNQGSDQTEVAAAVRCDDPLVSAPKDSPFYFNPRQLGTTEVREVSGVVLSPYGHGLIDWLQGAAGSRSLYATSIDLIDGQGTTHWGETVRLDNGGAGVRAGALAMNRCADGLLTWLEDDQSWYRVYRRQKGWLEARPIDDQPACAALSVNQEMAAVCLIAGRVAGRDAVLARHYEPGSGWSATTRIDSPTQFQVYKLNVAIDEAGNAMAVWSQYDDEASNPGLRQNIWANRFVAGEGWQGAVRIEDQDQGDADEPVLAIDALGNAYVAWVQFDGPGYLPGTTRTRVYFNRYSSSQGWAGERALSVNSKLLNATHASVAVNDSGIGVVAWNQAPFPEDISPQVLARQFARDLWFPQQEVTRGPHWKKAQGSFFAGRTFPDVAINNSGDIAVIWSAPSWSRGLFVNRYEPASGWGHAKGINPSGYGPVIAIDENGRSLAVYQRQIVGASDQVYGYLAN